MINMIPDPMNEVRLTGMRGHRTIEHHDPGSVVETEISIIVPGADGRCDSVPCITRDPKIRDIIHTIPAGAWVNVEGTLRVWATVVRTRVIIDHIELVPEHADDDPWVLCDRCGQPRGAHLPTDECDEWARVRR